MKIENMFQKDINRDINGVIKVSQNDEQSLEQELSEYIITKELRRHFNTFFDNYSAAIDTPTDKIGVWISGFFGSGKSHFLKMLSYLLSNQEVRGKHAIDYFKDKFDDPMMTANAMKCVSVPTESILFNIDIVAPTPKDKTVVLRTFAKMFYNHCGFYGDDLKIAKLERFIEKQGKTADFRSTFEAINGAPWVESRDSALFFEDDVVETLQNVLDMSEEAARNWFNTEDSGALSVEQLVREIKEYVDSKGKNFRLLFMIDEVGQFIGDDGDLMLNLQSLVEEIGTQCRGKVWIMVTSQEAIDSVVKITGDDFSKIQGRFNTRLSLSSSSVDEVIQKRVLAKTDEAEQLLELDYDKDHAVLKNLYTFNNPVLDIKGFSSSSEFVATYPFVPYQFIIIQKVLAEIRKHGNSGKHLSGGERSMLSGFQEAAQKIKEKDEHSLVPFYLFYDTVHTFLESAIRRVIDRAQTAADNGDGLQEQDVNVLKLLYLIRYIDDIKANIDNIAILMIDDVRVDKIALRHSVTESLERLLSQNYISRSGDTYAFLTDEEQDIANEIRHTAVDMAQINKSIADTVFEDIYPAKRFSLGKYSFDYDKYIDDTLHGSASGAVRLRIVTVAGDLHKASDQQLILESQANNEVIVVLSDAYPYYEELEQAKQIDKYTRTKNISQLPETAQTIIHSRQREARNLQARAKTYIEKSIAEGTFFVHGERIDLKQTNAKEKLDAAMKYLIESVYSKLQLIDQFAESDADILAILNGSADTPGLFASHAHNTEAMNEISQWLELQASSMRTVSMSDVQHRYQKEPFGWREIDIAALVARLIAQNKVTIKYGGANVAKEEHRLVDLLRKRSETDKAIITRRVAPSEALMRKSTEFLREYLNAMDIPQGEDDLVAFVKSTFEQKRDHYQKLLDQYIAHAYPEKNLLTQARDMTTDILSQSGDNVALLNRMVQRQDDLLDLSEDLEDLEQFFASQKSVFDSAADTLQNFDKERDYLSNEPELADALETISTILAMEKPYRRIGELPALVQQLKNGHITLLAEKKVQVLTEIAQCEQDVLHYTKENACDDEKILKDAKSYYFLKHSMAEKSSFLMELDAVLTQIQSKKDAYYQHITAAVTTPSVKTGDDQVAEEPSHPPKIINVSRAELCRVKRLNSREDIDVYVESIRAALYQAIDQGDGVQIG